MKRGRCIPVVVACALLAGRPGWAAKRSFVPRFVDLVAAIRLESRFRNLHHVTATTGRTTSRLAEHQEGLSFESLWYVYHPRFHYFTLGGELALRQERRKESSASWWEYKGNSDIYYLGYFLPEHPYNLTLLFEQKGGKPGGSLSLKDGDDIRRAEATFRYNPTPWSYELTYRWDTRKGDVLTSNGAGEEDSREMLKARNQEWSTAFRYTSQGFATAFRYRIKDGRRFRLVDGAIVDHNIHSQQGSFTNRLRRERWAFSSQWVFNQYIYREDLNRQTKYEQKLELELPYNFSSEIELEKTIKKQRYGVYAGENLSSSSVLDTDEYSIYGRLSHQLYASLRSQLLYRYDHSQIDSLSMAVDGGRGGLPTTSSRQRRRLQWQSDYSKRIFLDGRVKASVGVVHDRTDRSALQTVMVKDTFDIVKIGDSVISSRTEVDKDSVEVRISKTAGAGPTDELSETDFDVEWDDDYRVKVTIKHFPPGFDERSSYPIELSYRQLPGDYNLGVDTFDYTGELSFWKDYLTFFFERRRSRQELHRGVYTLGTLSPVVKRTRGGVTVSAAPFRSGFITRRRSFLTDMQNDWQVFSELTYMKSFGRLAGTVYGRLGRTRVEERIIAGTEYDSYDQREQQLRMQLRYGLPAEAGSLIVVSEYERDAGLEMRKRSEHRLDIGIGFPAWNLGLKYSLSSIREAQSGLPALEVRKDFYAGILQVKPVEQIRSDYLDKITEHHLQLRREWPEYFFRSTLTGTYQRRSSSAGEATSLLTEDCRLDAKGIWEVGAMRFLTGIKWEEKKTFGGITEGGDRFDSFEWYMRMSRRLF